MNEDKDKQEPEVADKEVVTEATVLSKDAFVQHLRREAKTEVVEGCRIQGLSGAGYQRLKGMRIEIMNDLPGTGEDREADYQEAECAIWLSLCVIEPKMDYHEWRHYLDSFDGSKIERIYNACHRLSNVEAIRLDEVKKALEAIKED